MPVIHKLLVANRGEIAVRIMRTAQSMGITTVAVFSDADKEAMFVSIANEAIALGGNSAAESYLVHDKIIKAARQTGADAIHPGYGFLSESADFAQRCELEGLTFIGPTSDVISKLGSKINAKQIAAEAGVPVIPGYSGSQYDIPRLKYEAAEIGYPLLIKASAGGGGKGMRIVHQADELEAAIAAAQREAEKSFGDAGILLEKYFPDAKHIEFQIFGDIHGNHLHLFDRECSLQRRYQKVIEESPSPSLSTELRHQMGEAAAAIAKAVNYTNAGTVEFLLDEELNFYFLEVNTRLQVEHPVTELVLGIDLVELQIKVAMGLEMGIAPEQLIQTGHAIECRVCAEDPENNFLPATGQILFMEPPFYYTARTDTGINTGSKIEVYYDSMLAKIISYAEERQTAISRAIYALDNFPLLGITTNTAFLKQLLLHPKFVDGTFTTKLIEHEFSSFSNTPSAAILQQMAACILLYHWHSQKQQQPFAPSLNGWRNIFYMPQIFEIEYKSETIKLGYRHLQNGQLQIYTGTETFTAEFISLDVCLANIQLNNHRQYLYITQNQHEYFVHHYTWGSHRFKKIPRFMLPQTEQQKGSYIAPMPGEIVKVLVQPGDKINQGKGLVVISSMKMETTIEAHSDGEVEEIFVEEKSFVEAGAVIIKIKSNEPN